MCQYCNYSFHDGWTQLLEYDDLYQRTQTASESQSTHGFQESWDELREELSL